MKRNGFIDAGILVQIIVIAIIGLILSGKCNEKKHDTDDDYEQEAVYDARK